MMEGGERHRKLKAIVTVVLLCSSVISLTFFSFQGLKEVVKRDVDISKAATLGVPYRSILSNRKKLDFQLDSVAAGKGLQADALTKSDPKATDDDLTHEAVTHLLNSSLECGPNEFKFKVLSSIVAGLKVEMGNEELLPLTHVPKSCGFSVEQTAQEIVVQAPYNGCGVEKQNFLYVLSIKWEENTINLVCNATSPDKMPPIPGSLQQPSEGTSKTLHRSKRHIRWPYMHHPCSPNRPFPLCFYTPPPLTTTAAPTLHPLANPYFWHKLLELYPVYVHHLQGHPQHLKHFHRHPVWQLLGQMNGKPPPQPYHFPLQHFFEKPRHHTTTVPPTTTVRTTTPCATTTTASSGGCPGLWRRFVPFHIQNFHPRVSFNGEDHLQSMDDYNTESRVIPDSFWESFPLLEGPR